MEKVQDWIIWLNSKVNHYSQLVSEIRKKFNQMNNEYDKTYYESMLNDLKKLRMLEKRLYENKMVLDVAISELQSAKFRLQLAYQMFPQLMDSEMTFANPTKDSEDIMIYSDYPKRLTRAKENIFDIAGEAIKTENDPISKEEYEELFNETIKQMVLDRKISQDDVSIKVGRNK